MESRYPGNIMGENIVTPSIMNNTYKAQKPMPAPQQPAQQIPVQQMPVQQTPVQQTPVQQMPVQQMPVQQMPVQQIQKPVQPIKQMPVQQPIKQMPVPMPQPVAPQPQYIQQPMPQPQPKPMPKPMPMPIQPQPVQVMPVQVMPQPIQIEQNNQIDINIQFVYPELYYRIQPHVIRACDRMDSNQMPTQDMIESLSDEIHSDVCRMYPEMVESVQRNVVKSNRRGCCCRPSCCNSAVPAVNAYRNTDQGPYRRQVMPYPYPAYWAGSGSDRGILRDIVGIMLINELTRRRRRYY